MEKAAERGATEVIGVDTSQAMIDLCAPVAAAYPGVASFSIGDAEKLPVDDNSFDSVVLGFVLLHLPSPAKALSEAFRVCKPGGKVSFSVWQTPEKGNLAFKMILDAIAKHGDPNVQLPGAPLPFFHFADEQNASTALAAAGFSASSVEVATIPCVAALESSADLFHMFKGATARTRALLEMQTAEQLKAIEEAMSIEVESAFTGANYGGVPRATSWLPAVPGRTLCSLTAGRRAASTIKCRCHVWLRARPRRPPLRSLRQLRNSTKANKQAEGEQEGMSLRNERMRGCG